MTARERELEAAVKELKNLAMNMLAICQSVRGSYGCKHEMLEVREENSASQRDLSHVQVKDLPMRDKVHLT